MVAREARRDFLPLSRFDEVAILVRLDYTSGREAILYSKTGGRMKNQPFFGARFLAVTIAVATLASCGGGGGGSGGGGGVVVPPAIPLTAANAQNVAGDAAVAAVQAPDRASRFGLAAGLGGSHARAAGFLEQQVERAVQALGPGRVTLAAAHRFANWAAP